MFLYEPIKRFLLFIHFYELISEKFFCIFIIGLISEVQRFNIIKVLDEGTYNK
jgi:hypothetical protein